MYLKPACPGCRWLAPLDEVAALGVNGVPALYANVIAADASLCYRIKRVQESNGIVLDLFKEDAGWLR
jgi:hypothetical protein